MLKITITLVSVADRKSQVNVVACNHLEKYKIPKRRHGGKYAEAIMRAVHHLAIPSDSRSVDPPTLPVI